MLIQCRLTNQPPKSPDWKTRWEGPDQGIICAWIEGVEKGKSDADLAAKALRGELPITPFKGGVFKAIKSKLKVGSQHYVAYWQGLRGEDLMVDLASEPVLTCTKTGVAVTFTSDVGRLLMAGEDLEATA